MVPVRSPSTVTRPIRSRNKWGCSKPPSNGKAASAPDVWPSNGLHRQKNPRQAGGFLCPSPKTLFLLFGLHETGELLLEARQAAAAVEQLLRSAGPGRMRLRVDIEVQRVTFLAPGRTRFEFGSIGHHDLDRVVIGVDIALHDVFPARDRALLPAKYGLNWRGL